MVQTQTYNVGKRPNNFQAFNVTNGDVFTWGKLWQHFAEYFGLKVALSDELLSIQEFMKDKEKVWDDIVTKHGLKV